MNNLIKNNSGFSFIELISILFILSIISTYIVMNTNAGINEDLYSDFEIAKLHMRYAQYLALTNDNYSWKINFNNTNYELFKKETDDTYNSSNFPHGSSVYNLQSSITIEAEDTNGNVTTIVFDYTNGEFNSPDETYIVEISDGSSSKSFKIEKNTGAVYDL